MQKTDNSYSWSRLEEPGDLAPYGMDAVKCNVNGERRLVPGIPGFPATTVVTSGTARPNCCMNNRLGRSPAAQRIRYK